MAVQLNRLPSHVRSLAEPQVLQQVDIVDIVDILDIVDITRYLPVALPVQLGRGGLGALLDRLLGADGALHAGNICIYI